MTYLTDEIRALIGISAHPIKACHPVQESEMRRFYQATMDPSPRYYDQAWAANSRYGALVAPPAFPVTAFRRSPIEVDPLDAMGSADFDGLRRELRPGLPAIEVTLTRLLNGGYEYEFFRFARPGEEIVCVSTYRDIYERDGASGTMVFVVVEDLYSTTDGEPLVKALNTTILR